MRFPRYRVLKSGGTVAINPAHVTAVYKNSKGWTEIYTLDCARDTDAWDVDADFDDVVEEIRQALKDG